MQHKDDTPEKREACFAKVLTLNERQVLAYLQRDESDHLTVIVQVWVARTDEQLRAAISSESDDLTTMLFASIDEDMLPEMFDRMGLTEILANIEGGV